MPELKSVISQSPPSVPLENVEPRRAPSVHSDVTVPLSQALVTAVAITLIPLSVCGMAIILFAERQAGIWWRLLGLLSLLVFSATLAKAWFWRMAWVESTIDKLESITGLDLPGNDAEPPHWVTVRTNSNGARRQADPVAAERQLLTDFVNYAFDNGTSVDALERRFDRREIARFRALLMRPDVGLATWNNAKAVNLGWRFVASKEDTLKTIDRIEVVETLPQRR